MHNEDKWSESELLRLAATACGYSWNWEVEKERYDLGIRGLWIEGVSTFWNPIEDSGQSFDLAAKLALSIIQIGGIVSVGVGSEKPRLLAYEHLRDEDAAAMRLAIVKAAAAIGGEKGRPGGTVLFCNTTQNVLQKLPNLNKERRACIRQKAVAINAITKPR